MKFFKLLPRFDNNPDLSGSNSMADAAVNTGKTAINSFDPTTTSGSQQGKLGSGGLGGLLGGETGDYVDKYTKTVANNPTVTSLYNTGNTMYNVPQLASTATNLSNRVTNAVPDAYRGARGFDIDSTDIQNGIAAKDAYLLPQSNAATANYNTAAGLASNFVQAGQAQNAQNLLPVQSQGQLLQQQEAAQSTGWNQASASEFQGLMDKMDQGIALSTIEMSRAHDLADAEEKYQQQLSQNSTEIAKANIGNQYQILPASQTLANTFTGKTYTAPG